jgi:CubicO group peptidase (beta-lactamase class C family)
MTINPRTLFAAIAAFVALALPTFAEGKTTLMIVKGSGDFQSLETEITVTDRQITTYQWTTDEAGASGATWKVTKTTAPNVVVATGKFTTVPAAGKFDRFDIPANAFLAAAPPASPVSYSISLVPHNAANVDLGAGSPVVKVTQAPAGPGITFGPNAVFPDVELVSYAVQLNTGKATLTVRLVNRSNQATDPFYLSTSDFNVLLHQPTPVAVDKIAKGAAPITKALQLTATLPPPLQVPQLTKWKDEYQQRCGVDLRVVIDWKGPQAQTPLGNHVERPIYIGSDNSTPAQAGTPEASLCDATTCVSLGDVARSIHKQLGCKVVGYSFFLGRGTTTRAEGVGLAHTAANAPAVSFTPAQRMQLASVSKVITALGAIKVLQNKNVGLDTQIGGHFPSGWTVEPNTTAKITFRQLLSQTSGIKNYGNYSLTDANLQAFFAQAVPNPNAPTPCTPAGNDSLNSVPNPITNNKQPCYSNLNFAIFRVLLPTIDGYTGSNAQTRADRYVKLVQDNVFTPIGVSNVGCKPPGSGTYAFSYKFPGSAAGTDWGDTSLWCGGAGWTVSANELGKMMMSLNSGDGKILSKAQFRDMETNPASHAIGFDSTTSGAYRWLEKNGGFTSGSGAVLSTSIAIFGGNSDPANFAPGVVGTLLINSDGGNANGVLVKAFKDSAHPKP